MIHRVRNLDAVAQWKADPPRMRREDNAIAMVDRAADDLTVVRLITDAARDRAIGVDRLRAALGRRSNVRRRSFVTAVLDDVAQGAQSLLEWAYLRWRQVFGTPCQTAARLERVLQARGWTGTLRRCPDCR